MFVYSTTHLGIEIIGQQIDEVALDGELVRHRLEVVGQFVVRSYYDSGTGRVELRPAGPTEDL